jgi:hypothetical protein
LAYLIAADFLLGFFFDLEDGGNIFLCELLSGYTALHPRI